MTIYLNKFGTTLNSRQFGKEASAAFKPSLKKVKKAEKVVVDFDGVVTFTPSWGDEFLSPLIKQFAERLILKNTQNPSVIASLKILERINSYQFRLK